MRVALSWLREAVDLEVSAEELARRLTMAGLEVEAVEHVGGAWRNVWTARVQDLEKHPRADALWIARLDAGDTQGTVVTAAPNLHVGAIVPWIRAGGALIGREIGTRKFQGVESEGMLCSGDELGISPDKDGIYLMEDEMPLGQLVSEVLGDVVLDVYITPNRPDCMSIVGIAREVHALLGGALHLPEVDVPRGKVPVSALVAVEIQTPGCPRFTAGVVQNVEIGPSPLWLQRRLYLSGVRPISNVVDVTNYVMLELGQPLHAFDRALLHGGIVVRQGRPGERLRTLDGQDRQLDEDMLVVADRAAARSLAGIMGGEDTEISADTRDVVLEAAAWDRAAIRLTSGRLNLASEAARRFGRGVDPELTVPAVARAMSLVVSLAAGEPADGLVDHYPGREDTPVVRTQPARINRLLGAAYEPDRMVSILSGLGFGVQEEGDGLVVRVPSWRRYDVAYSADLAEEVARVAGYESIPARLPSGELPHPDERSTQHYLGYADFSAEMEVRRILTAAGLQEVITYSLADTKTAGLGADEGAMLLQVANPQSADLTTLRGSLLGGLLETLVRTLRYRERGLLFELGRTWNGPLDPLPREWRSIGIVGSGHGVQRGWWGASEPLDFFDVKGTVETLCAELRVPVEYAIASSPFLHPGRAATVAAEGVVLGRFGELHPSLAEELGLEGRRVVVAEIDFDQLAALRQPLGRVATPSRFPYAERDVSAIVDESASHAAVEQAIRQAGEPLLQDARLMDVYRGQGIGEGRKSLLFRLHYQALDRTLDEAEVSAAHGRVEDELRRRYGAEIRGQD